MPNIIFHAAAENEYQKVFAGIISEASPLHLSETQSGER
jgi:hypothetical protein